MRTFLFVLLFASTSCHYNILGVFPHPGESHFKIFQPLMQNLAAKGHNVTVVSHFPQNFPNYENVVLELSENTTREVFDLNDFHWWYKYLSFHRLNALAKVQCENAFNSEALRSLLSRNKTYDVLVVEMFNSDCMLGLVRVYGAPFVGISSTTLMPFHYDRVGNPNTLSYVPNTLLLASDDASSFANRVVQTLAYVVHQLVYKYRTNSFDDYITRKHFGEGTPTVQEIANNCSVILVNQHHSLTLPRAQVPGVVDVGGIHVTSRQVLPQNIEKWINESTHGVIYFSLGSMIKGHTFPEEKRRIFLQAFARLPQRVLWKWENDTMPGKPDNVMIQKWMPQFDILCHPNVKAFISHGGLLGTTEAVHCGVPAIVMPQFGDQYTNAKAWEANNAAVILKLREVNEDNLQEALQKVLDPKFKMQAKELSERYRDRPMPPLETAIYWVEYVARHKGAAHLRTAAVGMPFYKYLLLDVVAFLFAVFAVMAYVNFWVWRWIFRKVFGKKSKEKTN